VESIRRPVISPPAGDDRAAQIGAFIVGAQRCGTTTLAAVLAEHPAICVARDKECHLFDAERVQREGVSGDDIDRFFAHRMPGQVLLDATPSYLYLPGCLEAIQRHCPDARIIVLLRKPVARAVSQHGHERRLGRETAPMFRAFLAERFRLWRETDPLARRSAHRKSSYVDRGRYDVQLRRLMVLSQSVHVVLFEEMIRSPQSVIDGVYDFLGVERVSLGALPHLNASDGHSSRSARLLARLLLGRSPSRTERLLGLPRGSLR